MGIKKKSKTKGEKEEKEKQEVEAPSPPEQEPDEMQRREMALEKYRQLMRETAELEAQKYTSNLQFNRQLLLIDLETENLSKLLKNWMTDDQLKEVREEALEDLDRRKDTTI